MKELAYYDGQYGDPSEVFIPFNDRSHFFGDGVYDATIAGNHVVYLLEEHLDRFYSSANELKINIPMPKDQLADLIRTLTAKVEGKTHFVYWQVTRGVASRNHAFDPVMPGKLWIYVRPQSDIEHSLPEPVSAITKPDTRFEHCNIKTINLLPSVMAYQDAKDAGVFETILHRGDIVTECAHSNVSILKDGVFYSHPNDQFILRGIGKTHLIQACYRCGVPVIERPFTLEELFNADEIIITASSTFCQSVSLIDGVTVGGKDPKTLNVIGSEALQEYLKTIGDV